MSPTVPRSSWSLLTIAVTTRCTALSETSRTSATSSESTTLNETSNITLRAASVKGPSSSTRSPGASSRRWLCMSARPSPIRLRISSRSITASVRRSASTVLTASSSSASFTVPTKLSSSTISLSTQRPMVPGTDKIPPMMIRTTTANPRIPTSGDSDDLPIPATPRHCPGPRATLQPPRASPRSMDARYPLNLRTAARIGVGRTERGRSGSASA